MTTPNFFVGLFHLMSDDLAIEKIQNWLREHHDCKIQHVKFQYHEGQEYDHYIVFIILKKEFS